MSRLLAADQSSKVVGIAILETSTKELLYSHTYNIKGITVEERIIAIKHIIMDLAKEYNVSDLILEDIQLQRGNVKTYKILAFVLGNLTVMALENELPCEITSPNEWRKGSGIVIGRNKNREMLKKESIELVEEIFGFTPSEDECEAILIGLHGCNLINARGEDWGIKVTKKETKPKKTKTTKPKVIKKEK